jgi:hypothetical protein
MGERYLIDTNVIIDFSANKLLPHAKSVVATIIDDGPYLSIINKIELLGFSEVNATIIELIECSFIIGLTEEIANRTISIRKSKKIKLPDAIVAATCIEHSLKLITRNVADFQGISEITIINPWDV